MAAGELLAVFLYFKFIYHPSTIHNIEKMLTILHKYGKIILVKPFNPYQPDAKCICYGEVILQYLFIASRLRVKL